MNKKLIKGVNVALLGAVFVLALFLVFPNVMADETYTNPLIEQELESAVEISSNLVDNFNLYLDTESNYNKLLAKVSSETPDYEQTILQNQINAARNILRINVIKNIPYRFDSIYAFNPDFFEQARFVTTYLVFEPLNSIVDQDIDLEDYTILLGETGFVAKPYINDYYSESDDFKELLEDLPSLKIGQEYNVYSKLIISTNGLIGPPNSQSINDSEIIEEITSNKIRFKYTKKGNIEEDLPLPAEPIHNEFNLDDWYPAYDLYLDFLTSSNLSTNSKDIAVIKDKLVNVRVGYTFEVPMNTEITEMQSVLLAQSSARNDKAIFYPVLDQENSFCEASTGGNELVRCKMEYDVTIYRSFIEDIGYKVSYIVYPEKAGNIISESEIIYANNKLKETTSKIAFFEESPYNGYVNSYQRLQKNLFKYYKSAENSVVIIENNLIEGSTASMSEPLEDSKTIVVLRNVNDITPNIKSMKGNRNSKIISIENTNIEIVENDMYLENTNSTRKLKDISTLLEQENIDMDQITSDISIVNIDDVPSYAFEVREKRRFLGINIGNKIVYKTMNAIEKIEE